jgi:hypothetical protein
MKHILLWIWQLPQHLLALIILLIQRKNRDREETFNTSKVYWLKKGNWGVSLGEYIILCGAHNDNGNTVRHEYGHSLQSRALGPLYLLVIGISSGLFNNRWDVWFHKGWTARARLYWYYTRFPEKQADLLGGATRPWTGLSEEQLLKQGYISTSTR